TRRTIDALYEVHLGRAADPSGWAHWRPKVEAAGPTGLARSLGTTTAHRQRLVRDRYHQILGRAPDPGGLAFWTGRLGRPGAEQAMVVSLLTTESFRVA